MGLRQWVAEKWVDIGARKKDGSYAPCGRSKGEKRKGYPKCVPLAKAKFKVYPSAYANMYASAVCSGKIVPGGRKKKMGGGSISQERKMVSNYKQGGVAKGCGGVLENRRKVTKKY